MTQDSRVPGPEGPLTRAPIDWLGPSGPGRTHKDAELPGDSCLHELWAPVSPSLCSQSPGLGRAGPPQPLSTAGDGLGIPPAAFSGVGRAELDPAEGDEETPTGGSLKRELWNSSSWTPAHGGPTVPPSLPANVRAARGASPATPGASVDGTWARGRHAQGILHSSAQIVTTLLSLRLW